MNYRWRWAVVLGGMCLMPLLIGLLGLETRHRGQPVDWVALYIVMLIVIVLIDLPLVAFVLWIAPFIERTYSRLLTEVLERSLHTTAYLFREQWEHERAAGTLPRAAHEPDERTQPPAP